MSQIYSIHIKSYLKAFIIVYKCNSWNSPQKLDCFLSGKNFKFELINVLWRQTNMQESNALIQSSRYLTDHLPVQRAYRNWTSREEWILIGMCACQGIIGALIRPILDPTHWMLWRLHLWSGSLAAIVGDGHAIATHRGWVTLWY